MTLPRPAPAAWTTSRFGNAGVGDPGATEAKNLPFGHLFEVNQSVGGDLDLVKLNARHTPRFPRDRGTVKGTTTANGTPTAGIQCVAGLHCVRLDRRRLDLLPTKSTENPSARRILARRVPAEGRPLPQSALAVDPAGQRAGRARKH